MLLCYLWVKFLCYYQYFTSGHRCHGSVFTSLDQGDVYFPLDKLGLQKLMIGGSLEGSLLKYSVSWILYAQKFD